MLAASVDDVAQEAIEILDRVRLEQPAFLMRDGYQGLASNSGSIVGPEAIAANFCEFVEDPHWHWVFSGLYDEESGGYATVDGSLVLERRKA